MVQLDVLLGMRLPEYGPPLLTIACFYAYRSYSAIHLQKAPLGHNSQGRRRIFAISIAAIVLSYLALAGTAVWSGIATSTDLSHAVVGYVAFALIWIAIWRQTRAERRVQWKHIIATAVAALFFQNVSVPISGSTKVLHMVALANSSTLLGCITLAVKNYRTVASGFNDIDESKNGEDEKDAIKAWEDEDSDADDEDEDAIPAHKKDLMEKKKKRLEEAGNWFSYLKPYKLFVPLIFPFGNRKLQAGIVYLVFHLTFTRILSFLVPRQMGIIADKLTTHGAGKSFPKADIIIWALLQFTESELCYTIREMVFLPIHNYVYKSICSTAFRHVMGLSMDFHHDKSSSDVIRTVYQGENLTQIVSFICFDLSPLATDIVIAIAFVTTTFEPYLMLIMLTSGIVNCWLAEDRNKWSRKMRVQYNKARREMSRAQYEALGNWQTVSQFNHNKFESDKYAKLLDDYCALDSKMTMTYSVTGALQGSFMLAARLGATALVMYRVSQGQIPYGQLVTFISVWGKVMNPIQSLSRLSRRMQNLLTDSERLLILLETKSTVQDKPTSKPFEFKAGSVELENVDFSYDARKATLTDVSVKVPAGSTVALVGETGGGKTTLIRMLYRYYDVTGGSIRIDDQDLRDVQIDSLRNVFGFVPQDPALFNTTLLENLRYARLDATDEDIENACRAACIHDKIMQFPDKYQSKVGERGVKLSGGEMQRIAVARAILRDPKIVLLDEATSMIDAETEHLIQKALRRLTAGRTTFVVAHRLSTIQHADLILVIEDGKIIERGNHEELFRKGGKYVKLWSKQMSKHVDGLAPIQVISGVDTPPQSD